MINQTNTENISQILSATAQNAYKKLKALIMKIFSLIKKQKNNKELREEFYHTYISFARRLKEEGHDGEYYLYMTLCQMYDHLIDRPDELLAHKEFFINLFDKIDELLFLKIHNPEEYDEKYKEFRANFRKVRRYFYTEVATPSEKFDEESLYQIANSIFKVVE